MKNTHEVETLLIVDDEEKVILSLKRLFRPLGHRIFSANSGAEGLDLLQREKIDLVISDMRMPMMDGAVFLKKVALSWPNTMRILLTGYADLSSTIKAINEGQIYRYVSKPWNDKTLVLIVKQALQQSRIEAEKLHFEQRMRKQSDAVKHLNASLERDVSTRTDELCEAMGLLEKSYESQKIRHVASIKTFAKMMKEQMQQQDKEKQVLVKALQAARSQAAERGAAGNGCV